jgi:hypothetical protein
MLQIDIEIGNIGNIKVSQHNMFAQGSHGHLLSLWAVSSDNVI